MANNIKTIKYIGQTLYLHVIDCHYVLTFKDINDDYKMYVCYTNINNELLIDNGDTKIKIAELTTCTDENGDYQYYSEYGEIDSIINFKHLVIAYNQIQEKYTDEDVNEILEMYKNDYINKKDNVKKLKLK